MGTLIGKLCLPELFCSVMRLQSVFPPREDSMIYLFLYVQSVYRCMHIGLYLSLYRFNLSWTRTWSHSGSSQKTPGCFDLHKAAGCPLHWELVIPGKKPILISHIYLKCCIVELLGFWLADFSAAGEVERPVGLAASFRLSPEKPVSDILKNSSVAEKQNPDRSLQTLIRQHN